MLTPDDLEIASDESEQSSSPLYDARPPKASADLSKMSISALTNDPECNARQKVKDSEPLSPITETSADELLGALSDSELDVPCVLIQ